MKTIPNNISDRSIKVEKGTVLQICRWDWNGINSEEKVISITPLDNFSAKIRTKNGSIIFDTRKDTYFKWCGKSKFDWERKYQTNVSFKNCYIQYDESIKSKDFQAGYRAKETEIQELIEGLEQTIKEYAKDLDITRRINYEEFTQSKIKTLKQLL